MNVSWAKYRMINRSGLINPLKMSGKEGIKNAVWISIWDYAKPKPGVNLINEFYSYLEKTKLV